MSTRGINTSLSAIHAYRRVLDADNEDLQKINDPNHSRQVVVLKDQPPTRYANANKDIYVGNGVAIDEIKRVVDGSVEAKLRDSLGARDNLNQLYNNLKGTENILNEVGALGITTALDNFYNSWSQLGTNPTSIAHKAVVQERGIELSHKISSSYGEIQNQISRISNERTAYVHSINNLGNQIATLNKEIILAGNGSPNSFLDQRDGYILELSKLIDVYSVDNKDGSISVSAGGFPLIDGINSLQFPTTYDTAGNVFTDGTKTYALTGGKLQGTISSIKQIQGVLNQLDLLADNLRTQVNTLHASGNNSAMVSGINFFNTSLGAGTLDLAPEVLTDANEIRTGVSGKVDDGGLAIDIATSKNTALLALNSKTIGSYYENLTDNLAANIATYKNMLDTQNAIVKQDESRRSSVRGVSRDEIMIHMMKTLKDLKANMKMFDVYNKLADNMINLGG